MSAAGIRLDLCIDWMGRPLTSNKANKMHWGAVGRERTAWGDAAIQAARIAGWPRSLHREFGRVRFTVESFYPRKPIPDSDNLAPTVKGIIDGLVRGGYLVDDSPEFVAGTETIAPSVGKTASGLVCVFVSVESAPVRITEDETNGPVS